MGERFYLRFENEGIETVYIDEPFGYDSAGFNIKQEDKRYARDISFSDGEIDFEYNNFRNHKIDKLLYVADRYGFEAKVVQGIEKDGEAIELDLDFKNSKSDGLNYLRCKLIQDSKLQVVKRNKDVKVNLMSDKDLLGNPIAPLVPENILLKAKPLLQYSEWKLPQVSGYTANNITHDVAPNAFDVFNWLNGSVEYGIENSVGFIQGYKRLTGTSQANIIKISDYKYITAQENISDLMVDFSDIKINFVRDNFNTQFRVNAYYLISSDEDFQYNERISLYNHNNPTQLSINQTVNVNMERGQSLYFWVEIRILSSVPALMGSVAVSWISGVIKAKGTLTAYNSVVPSFRLFDVMRYVIKSISGLDIEAPRFGDGGEFYDQRLFNGNFLRNITDKPFYVTLKQIEEGITEFNGDYEIQPDGKVFFGLHRDFYTDNEIAFFSATQFESFSKTFNPRFTVNKFVFEYKSYQSQKENSEENTADSVHGESEWKLPNVNADNPREISVGWIRDAFLIESNRRKGIEESNNTATQDDDKIFIVDTYIQSIQNLNALYFNETSFLQHSYNQEDERLTLRNTGEFSFIQLGITEGQPFAITQFPEQQPNSGSYSVSEVGNNFIVLDPIGNPASPANDGERHTNFTYFISTEGLSGVNWTNEGFTSIDNIESGNTYSNLRFSTKRNIINYHQEYLTACNYYHKNQYIACTFYKNNPDAQTSYEGTTIGEGADFIPNSNMLTPVLFEDCVFITPFSKYVQLANRIRTVRGFIRAIGIDGNVIKFYPKTLNYDSPKEQLTVAEGEEKYEPVLINIVSVPNGISINYEYQFSALRYGIQGEKVLLMDNENELLYNPVFWNRIAINGNIPENLNQLQEWLSLL